MSRSYRKNPIHGHGGGSEKECKRSYNRALRSNVHQNLNTCDDFENLVLPIVREIRDVWNMAKDGKSFSDDLAAYKASLAKVFRTRGGRTRFFYAVTASTMELMEQEARERYLRWKSWFPNSLRHEEAPTNRDLRRNLELLRK
jgi:hypothetical protein